jgi:type VI secretion system protein ImpE
MSDSAGSTGSADSTGDLFAAGRLDAALASANRSVRSRPADAGARIVLAELLVFAGNLERAELVLDAAAAADPACVPIVAEFRQLLRAEMARRQVWRDGRVPEFLAEPTQTVRMLLAAQVAFRAGDLQEATRLADAAEAVRPHVPGRRGDRPFSDFRDADDLRAGILEVLTTAGTILWIPTERITSLAFHAPRRPRDLAWRRARIAVADGPEGDVFVPALYPSLDAEAADAVRLGHVTEWTSTTPVRGSGQLVFLADEDGLAILELGELRFGA